MNTIAASELKRLGITAIEKLLVNGPVHIIKHNQPACVVLAEDDYERLLHAVKGAPVRQLSVMEWFALPPLAMEEKAALDARITHDRDEWDPQ